jgi:BlaI family penicillinase repressor
MTKRDFIFTDRELDVMDILWERGSGTVLEVKERIEDELAYTTVLTVLRTLEGKGFIAHESEGRAYRYFPVVEKRQAQDSHRKRLVRKLYSGSPELLLEQIVSDDDVSKDELKRMKKAIDRALKA